MNPIWLEILGVALRWALSSISGYLVANHILTADQQDRFTGAIVEHALLWAPGAVALAWGLWARYRGRVKFLTALESPAGTTEEGVKARIANGLGSSVATGAILVFVMAGAAAFTMPNCASAPPAGTYSTAGLKAFNADQLLKDVTALSETAINLNATTGSLHLKDRDTAIVRDFALSAGAGLVAYADGKGSLAVIVSAFDELTRKLSAEAALNDKLRFILALVADNIHRIPQ